MSDTRGLAAWEDHAQNAKQRKAFPEDMQVGGPPGQWRMGEMRFWRLLEAEMRLPGQRGPSRSCSRRPHRGGVRPGVGENEELQPWAGQMGC